MKIEADKRAKEPKQKKKKRKNKNRNTEQPQKATHESHSIYAESAFQPQQANQCNNDSSFTCSYGSIGSDYDQETEPY